ncbi:sigma 54-interacting transcriptional regulator [Enhygromyxa salina]|uniref:Nif-specific regulatory protein n=1 Tax=Enhygromyxa salina TaxID=215803 RepID=A0A2S9YML0_9BACT|nr:sigma 54-interacting transcriptional regulator [Enhygromyxa salina]PRQ06315.1 Nif-specific regulatory protein [Enhygromyxa salina]
MAGSATTCADPSTLGLGAIELRWCLTVVHARDPGLIGRRRVLGPDEPLELGRGCAELGDRVLEDDRISRRHLRLEIIDTPDVGERVELTDLGSHNGSFVDARRVEHATVDAGALIGLGRVLLLLHRAPLELPRAPALPGLVGCGWSHAKLLEAVDKIATRSITVMLLGPTGAGKSALAEAIHERSGRTGRLHRIPCATQTSEGLAEQLQRLDPESTVYLDSVGEASPGSQASLLPLLELDRADGPRIIASNRTPLTASVADGRVRADLATRLERWLIHVPPLASRREDLTSIARHFAERHAGEPRALHFKLARALLLHELPGNLHELEAVIECACIDAEPDGPLPLSPQVRALLERDGPPREARGGPGLTVARDGSWFCLTGHARVDMGHRRPLTRLVRALAEHRLAHPGQSLELRELLALGWPDEHVVERAGANRVYVALTTLRKLGLRDVLQRDDHGYMFAPELALEIR